MRSLCHAGRTTGAPQPARRAARGRARRAGGAPSDAGPPGEWTRGEGGGGGGHEEGARSSEARGAGAGAGAGAATGAGACWHGADDARAPRSRRVRSSATTTRRVYARSSTPSTRTATASSASARFGARGGGSGSSTLFVLPCFGPRVESGFFPMSVRARGGGGCSAPPPSPLPPSRRALPSAREAKGEEAYRVLA